MWCNGAQNSDQTVENSYYTSSSPKGREADYLPPLHIIGSAEALPILCVRYFRWERERERYCAWGTFGEREREREIQTERERERERERETERDGSDVTIVALKLAMNLHFPMPKIRTIGDELTLSLAKNSHFSFLPSHFPSLPSRRGHHCGAEIDDLQNYRKRGSASYIVREVQSVRERERDGSSETEVVRRKWRHHCRAKISDKFALVVSPFTLPVSPFKERSPLWNIEKLDQINTKNYWK